MFHRTQPKQSLPPTARSHSSRKSLLKRTAINEVPAPPAAARTAPATASSPTVSPLPIRPLAPLSIQPKLKVDPPDSPLEREADEVAEKVMRMPDPGVKQIDPDDEDKERIQRAWKNEDDETKIQRKCAECEEEDKLQRKAANSETPEVTPGIQSQIQTLKTGGQPLSETDRSYFEPRFGRDFSRVRVHTDSAAAQSAGQLDAKAYTLGNHIAFAAGKYAPQSSPGRKLLAHELTHTVQQGDVVPTSMQRQVVDDIPSTELEEENQSQDPFHYGVVAGNVERMKSESAVVVAPRGIRLHATPSTGDVFYNMKSHHAAQIYPQWTELELIGVNGPESSIGEQWAAVSTSKGIAGWIERRYLSTEYEPEDPTVFDYHIIEGADRLQTVIQHTYSGTNIIEYGRDERSLAEAIIHVNRLSAEQPVVLTGTYDGSFVKDDLLDREMARARELFAKVRLTEGRLLKLPTIAEVTSLVDSGVVSQRPEWKNVAGELVRSIEGFVTGVGEGFVEAAQGTVTGLWSLMKGLFSGELRQQAEQLYRRITDMGWDGLKQLLGEAFSSQIASLEDWFHGKNPKKKWQAVGRIFGMILFEVVLFAATAGAVAAISKAPRVVATVNRVRALTAKIPSLESFQGKLRAGTDKIKSKLDELAESMVPQPEGALAGGGRIPHQMMMEGKSGGGGTRSPRKTKAKERRKEQQEEDRQKRFGDPDYQEPASESYARKRARELEKKKGKDARRRAHDEKDFGNRTKSEIDEDYSSAPASKDVNVETNDHISFDASKGESPKQLKSGDELADEAVGHATAPESPPAKLSQQAGETPSTTTSTEAQNIAPTRASLLGDLASAGVKHTPDQVTHIARRADGTIVFLERGNARAGLQHIIDRHADDFVKAGIPEQRIADAVFEAAQRGTRVGIQGTRPIYEVTFGAQRVRIAVTVGDNGFIVGANPVSF